MKMMAPRQPLLSLSGFSLIQPEGFRHLWREAVSSQKGIQPEGLPR
jgi:hypothetical protein